MFIVVVVFKLKVISVEDSISFVFKAVVLGLGCPAVCESSRFVSFVVTELLVSCLVVVVFLRKIELERIKSMKSKESRQSLLRLV